MNKKHKIWQSHIPGSALGANVVSTKIKDRKTGKIVFGHNSSNYTSSFINKSDNTDVSNVYHIQ